MSSLLVQVRTISNIYKHPNADKLSIVEMEGIGWQCIVGLNQYKVGDKVVFCPPDSVIPTNIIEKYNLEYLKKNGRVDTVKLRGFISQGLILDLNCLPKSKKNWEGQELSNILGITKYEPMISSNLQVTGKKPTKYKSNPLFDKYTEIENIKNYKNIFQENDEVIITEKIHGTNVRYGNLPRYKSNIIGKIKSLLFGKYEFCYGSHNIQLKSFSAKNNFYGEDIYGKIARQLDLAKLLPIGYIFYGEIYGKKIQDLTYGLEDITIRFFDIKNIKTEKYVDYDEFFDICNHLGLAIVPVLYRGNFNNELLQTYTIGNSFLYPNQIKEGCVIKSLKEEIHPRIGRKILKSINPEYLLKKDRTEYH